MGHSTSRPLPDPFRGWSYDRFDREWVPAVLDLLTADDVSVRDVAAALVSARNRYRAGPDGKAPTRRRKVAPPSLCAMTDWQVRVARRLPRTISDRMLADWWGLSSHSPVQRARSGRSYRHVPMVDPLPDRGPVRQQPRGTRRRGG